MNCPVCPDQVLTMSERQGVEIDYCPNCRGLWLDRGELDKLLAKAEAQAVPAAAPRQPDQRPDDRYDSRPNDRYDSRSDDRYDSGYDRKKSKKKSFLGEILDF